MPIRVLGNRFIVALEGVTDTNRISDQITDAGIILSALGGFDGIEAKLGLADRWGRVIEIGPDCRDIQPGDRVMIEAQKWTEGFKNDDVWLWMSQEDYVIFIDDLFRETGGKQKTKTETKLEIQ